jgi:hypothetical protein
MKKIEKEYKQAIQEIIEHQIKVLGPQIALAKVGKIKGLVINDKGEVLELNREHSLILQDLVNEYSKLSGLVFKAVMSPIIKKYPDLPIYVS